MNAKTIPVLAIRQPWAGLIAGSYKTAEHRTYPAPEKYIGQDIAIYASRTTPKKEDLTQAKMFLARYGYKWPLWTPIDKPRGYIVAVATLAKCRQVSRLEFNQCHITHANAPGWYVPGKSHIWTLENIRPLKHPVSFKFSGSMVWSSALLDDVSGGWGNERF